MAGGASNDKAKQRPAKAVPRHRRTPTLHVVTGRDPEGHELKPLHLRPSDARRVTHADQPAHPAPPARHAARERPAEAPAEAPPQAVSKRQRGRVRIVHDRTPEAPRFEVGTLMGGRYRVEALLGEGGMGRVYRAEDVLLEMPVAVKILNQELTNDRYAVAKLKKEARITLQLTHPHIVRLFDMQKVENTYMLIMEYVGGESFRTIIRTHSHLATQTCLQVVETCADAVAHAHQHGILHNDLKPDNLMLTEEGVLKVIDFGTAGMTHSRSGGNYIVGTPAYMSPEQIRGDVLDERTDVYALGMIACELLSGDLPYARDAGFEDVLARPRGPLPALPPALMPVIEKAIAPDSDDRWPSMDAFAGALQEAGAQG